MLVVGIASCDTPSTATSTENQTDTAAVNTMDNTTTTPAPDTATMKTDTSTVKKDTTTTTP